MRVNSYIFRLLISLLFSSSSFCYASDELSLRITEQLLDSKVPPIPLQQALGNDAYQAEMKSGKYKYIGSSKCRLCHRDFFLGRKGDKHDQTFKRLTDSDQQRSPQCLVCHSTGYGVKSGFVSISKTPRLVNVQCEGCHGPGNIHMLSNSAGGFLAGTDRPEILKKMCKSCHSQRWSHSYKNFDEAYDSYKTAKPQNISSGAALP